MGYEIPIVKPPSDYPGDFFKDIADGLVSDSIAFSPFRAIFGAHFWAIFGGIFNAIELAPRWAWG